MLVYDVNFVVRLHNKQAGNYIEDARKGTTVGDMLALPTGMKEDVKALGGIVKRWTLLFESTGEELFGWAKKHKFLLAFATGLYFFIKFLLDEQKEKEDY